MFQCFPVTYMFGVDELFYVDVHKNEKKRHQKQGTRMH